MKIGNVALRSGFLAAAFSTALLVLSSCNVGDEVDALQSFKDGRKVWVFTQVNVANEGGELDSYYYYGRVSEKLYERIKNNKIARGFLLLDEVRYYSSKDDKIHSYKDKDTSGELVFRIEDIKRIQLLAKPPPMEKPQGGEPVVEAEPEPTDSVAAQEDSKEKTLRAKKRD
jgi:hypothetical protein